MRKIILFLTVVFFSQILQAQDDYKTYCNPVNIDYAYVPIPDFTKWGHHRATADPVIVNYKGDYYLFSTNQWGYWWSQRRLPFSL